MADKKGSPEGSDGKKKRVILKKGMLLKHGRTGLTAKKASVEVAVGPSAFVYNDNSGQPRKENPIVSDGVIALKGAAKGGWQLSYTIPEGRHWLFTADSEEEQLQWAGAFQIAIVAVTNRTPKAKQLYSDAYKVLDALREAKKSVEVNKRPYVAGEELFMTDELVAIAGQRLMDVSSALTDIQDGRKSEPWWGEVIKYYNNYIPAIKAAIDLMSRRLTAHRSIANYLSMLKESQLLLQQGQTRASERKWAEISALCEDMFQGGSDGIYKVGSGKEKGQLIADIAPFKVQYERDSAAFQKLLDQCMMRDGVIMNELRADPFLRSIHHLDRSLVCNLTPYKHGPGFVTEGMCRMAVLAHARASKFFQDYCQEVKASENSEIRNFIGENKQKLLCSQTTLQALERRQQFHLLLTEYTELSEPIEGLVYGGLLEEAQEEWGKVQALATKILNWPEEHPSEEPPAKSAVIRGVVVEEDRESFAVWYRERVQHINKLFRAASEQSKTMELSSGTGMGLIENAFHWLEHALTAVSKKYIIKFVPLSTYKSSHPKTGQQFIWTVEKGLEMSDVTRAGTCADSVQRVLTVVVQHFSFPGFNEKRMKWETTIRAARETITHLQVRVEAQTEIEKFFNLSLSVEYFLSLNYLDDAKNAWTRAEKIAEAILDRGDFRLPGDQKYLPDVQMFSSLYTQRSTQVKAAIQTAAAAKLYIKKVPMFAALHGDEDSTPIGAFSFVPKEKKASAASAAVSGGGGGGGGGGRDGAPAAGDGPGPDQLYPMRSEGGRKPAAYAGGDDDDDDDYNEEEGGGPEGGGGRSPSPSPAPAAAAAAPAAAAAAAASSPTPDDPKKKKSNPFGEEPKSKNPF